MSKFEELKEWLNQLPEGSDICLVETSIYEDDARILVKTPSGEILSKVILDTERQG